MVIPLLMFEFEYMQRRAEQVYVIATTLQTERSMEKGGGGAPDIGAEIPLQAMMQTMVKQLCPCSPWRSMVEQMNAQQGL
ncbi:hypothetical protein TURU_144238 [Turdus rufiventris]|nr:hypothetical protein TURU_144238 [Turdus rufiventris]